MTPPSPAPGGTADATRERRAGVLAAIAVLLTVGTIELADPPRRPPLTEFDQRFYLGIAWDILHRGRFTDGFYFAPGYAADRRPPGMRFGPLVPAFLAVSASVDPAFRVDLDCLVDTRGDAAGICGSAAPLPRRLQALMMGLGIWLIWPIARASGLAIGGRAAALGLALLTAPMLLSDAAYLMTESASFLLTSTASLALVRAIAAPVRAALLAGIALGVATLVRPDLLFAVPVAAIALLALRAGRGIRARLSAALLVMLGAGLAIGPWVARNWVVLGDAGVSAGYAGHTLAQRVSFDRMTDRDLGLAFVCWLPDGNGLGRAMAGRGACDRFGWDDPGSFYQVGMREIVPHTLRAAGGPARHVAWLMRHEVFPHFGWHLATSVPLALRGLWIDHWWGLLLAPCLLWLALTSLRDAVRGWADAGRRAYLALSLVALSVLGLHAFVAVDQPRYNLLLIPPLAIAGAAVLGRIGARIRTSSRAA